MTHLQMEDEKHRTKLYVANIPPDLHGWHAFRQYFERYGQIHNCFLHESKKFGHVTYYDHESASRVLHSVANGELNNLFVRWWNEDVRHKDKSQSSSWRGGRRRENRPVYCDKPVHSHTKRKSLSADHRISPDQRTTLISPVKMKLTLFWKDFDCLPAKENTRCLLLKDVDDSLLVQNLLMYFGNSEFSRCGPLKNIVKMVDGILIVFENDIIDCSATDSRNHIIGGKEFKIYEKTIPSFYSDRFVISNLNDGTHIDAIELLVENCSKNETSPSLCLKTSYPGVYLVQFDDNFDITEIDSLIQNICASQLDGKQLKASRLLKTDCINVTFLNSTISNDVIRMFFQNKKRSSGGPVTRVERLRNEAALVYFASYLDAEQVDSRFNSPNASPATIQQQKLNVELYFHCIKNDHEKTGDQHSVIFHAGPTEEIQQDENLKNLLELPLSTHCRPLKEGERVLQFICANTVHLEEMKVVFANLAEIKILSKSYSTLPLISCVPIQQAKSSQLNTQSKFDNKCESLMVKFMENYRAYTEEFDEDSLEKVKTFTAYLNSDEIADNFRISWNEKKMEIVGTKLAVTTTTENIASFLSKGFTTLKIKKEQYSPLINCGILEDVKRAFEDVVVECCDEEETVNLTGSKLDIANFQTEALIQLNTLHKFSLKHLDPFVSRFLLECLKNSTENEIVSLLHHQFRFPACICCDETEPYILVSKAEYGQVAVKVISDYLLFKNVKIQNLKNDVVLAEIKRLQLSTSLKHIKAFAQETENAILIVGIKSEVSSIQIVIERFVNEHSQDAKLFMMKYGKAKYVIKKFGAFSVTSCKKNGYACKISDQNGGGIVIRGSIKSVKIAVASLHQLVPTIMEEKFTVKKHGTKKYFLEKTGREFLANLELLCDCVILTSYNEEQKLKINDDKQNVSLSDVLQRDAIPPLLLQCNVTLVEGDITDQKIDVIVNTTTPERLLDMNGSSISKALLKYTGAMHSWGRVETDEKDLYQPFAVGEVRETGSGCLGGCVTALFHALITHYNAENGKELIVKVVSRCLEKADSSGYSSICFPAIGTGGYGYPASSVAKWMKKTFLKFQGQCLRNIIIVLFPKNAAVIKAFKAVFQPRFCIPLKVLAQQSSHYSSKIIGSFVVSVYQGIAKHERSDLLVEMASSHSDSDITLTISRNGLKKQLIRTFYSFNMLEILKFVADLKVSSVSICNTDSKVPVKLPTMMRVGIETFAKYNTTVSLKHINIVLRNSDHVTTYIEAIIYSQSKVVSEISDSDIPNWLLPVPMPSTLDFHIYSTTKLNVTKAINHITNEVKKITQTQVINDPTIQRLHYSDRNNFEKMAKNHDVKFSISEPDHGQITLEGLTDKVLKVHGAIKDRIRDFVAAESCFSYVRWQKFHNNIWLTIACDANYRIEKIFKEWQQDKRKEKTLRFKISHNDTKIDCIVDFAEIQADPSGITSHGCKRKVLAQQQNVCQTPTHWLKSVGSSFKRVELTPGDAEFQTVAAKFRSREMPYTRIVSIQRIQNLSLYTQYIAKKNEVAGKMLTFLPVERQLFHGTSESDNIAKQGFDRSFCGKNATAYGRGAYFATYSRMAHLYTEPNILGQRKMFLADVVTGEYCKGRVNYKAPPHNPRRGNATELFDSVVDDASSPSIFVIFKDASAYPAYLITYI